MIENRVRKNILEIVPYDPKQRPYDIKLDANESAYGLPESMLAGVSRLAADPDVFRLYPDSNCVGLREKIGAYINTDPARIIVGLGSDQLISVISQIFIDPGDTVVVPYPSFEMYSAGAVIAGGQVRRVELRKDADFAYDADEFISAAKETHAKIAYVCTPNNPTGGTMDCADISRMAAECPDTLIVVDEAYAEFGGGSALGLVALFENVVVLKTFSKAWGLAGLRCGYAVAGGKVANWIYAVKPPYNVPTFTQKVAGLALDAAAEINAQAARTAAERDRFAGALKARLGGAVKVFPSSANFLLIKINGTTGNTVREALAAKGTLVRAFASAPVLADCVRITVGTAEQHEILLGQLAEVCRDLGIVV